MNTRINMSKNKFIGKPIVSKKEGKIYVNMSVTHYDDPFCRQKIKLQTSDVVKILQENNHKNIGRCIKHGTIHNKKRTSDQWIFEDISPPLKKIKSKKTLDKSEKDVIIEVQEKTLPLKED